MPPGRFAAVKNPRAVSPWPFVGMVGMACALFLYAFSGLLAPWYAVVALLAVWLGLFVLALRWWTRHPRRVPLLALAAIGLWFAVLNAGGAWLGWTA